jgi:hypothetical protein
MYLIDAIARWLGGPRPAKTTESGQQQADAQAAEAAAPGLPAVNGLLGGLGDTAAKAVQVTQLAQAALQKIGATEGRAELVTFGGAPVAVGVAAAQVTRKAAQAVGIKDERLVKTLEQSVALGPLAPSVLAVQGFSAALNLVAPGADKALRHAVKKLDITSAKAPAGKAVRAVGRGIKKLFGG